MIPPFKSESNTMEKEDMVHKDLKVPSYRAFALIPKEDLLDALFFIRFIY